MIAELFAGLDAVNDLAGNPRPQPYRGGRVLDPLTTGQEYQPEQDIDRAYDEILRKSAMVDRCVSGKADKGGSVPLRVWERGEAGKASPVGDHPLDEVLNSWRRDPVEGSREEGVSRAITHHQLTGNGLVGIRRARDITLQQTVPVELESEDPREIYPVPSPLRGKRLQQWNWSDGDGQRFAWKREDLIHWKRHDPSNPLWGRSVLEALATTVHSSIEGERTHLIRLTRDGRPGMIIADSGITSAKDGQEKENLLNARQRTNRGGIMLLAGEDSQGKPAQRLVSMGMSSSDLGILESMAFDRDMIAIAFGYLPAGFSNDASTYNNSGIFVLHEWALVQSLMSSFCGRLEAFLLSREERRRFSIAPDYSEVQVLQDANLQKLEILKDLAFKGYSTNDLIRATGVPLPLQRFGDEPLVPENVQPLAFAMSQEL